MLLLALALAGRDVRVGTMPELLDAIGRARPGDRIRIARGVYRVEGRTRIRIANRPGPIELRGETGRAEDVIFKGAGQDDPSVVTIFELLDSPRWTLADFTTRATMYHGVMLSGGSTDCTLRGLTMREHGEGGIKGTFDPARKAYPDRLLVERCDIGWEPEAGGLGGSRPVVEGIDGVAVEGWRVRGCTFRNVRKRNGGLAYAVFTKGNSADTIIENNRFESCDIGASFGGGGTAPQYFRNGDRAQEHRGGLIRGNVFSGSSDTAIYLNRARDARVEGNTISGARSGVVLRYPETSARVLGTRFTPLAEFPDEPAVRLREGARRLP